MVVYFFVMLMIVITFSFGCFAPVQRLAVKIVFKMTYIVSSEMLNFNSSVDWKPLTRPS